MSWRTLRPVIAFVLLVVLHYTLRPVLGWRTSIDFLVIALLIASVRMRPGLAALLGFAMGLVADSLSVGAFGSAALAMSVVGFTASWLRAIVFAENLALHAAFFFAGKWLFDIVFLIIERRLKGFELITQLFIWSPITAMVTALAGILVLILMRPMLETQSA
ncbi:MAG TPA: rod shape-determining protein MreD [Gemmatimonadaceae bacterium]|jgi:rod shape-determining protein MreD|nr:rod shape-determining protein MreD [Gemmatimonadaceae bacterium]